MRLRRREAAASRTVIFSHRPLSFTTLNENVKEIDPSERSEIRCVIDHVLRAQHVDVDIVIEVDNVETIKRALGVFQAVARGGGVS